MTPLPKPLLALKALTVSFFTSAGQIKVVNQLSCELSSGQTLGMVGESGAGKSMTAMAILGLVPSPGKISGSIRFRDQELVGLKETDYEEFRGGKISIVFQDPATALNPLFTIERQLVETIVKHKKIPFQEAKYQAIEHLKQVEISSPEKRIKDYPHRFSGGMKQRILIAMALACEPDCLILDEPTTALDVTVQSQILDLIERIQNIKKMAIILISHDLCIISEISHKAIVLYGGRKVESGNIETLITSPCHPYTWGLLNSIPRIGQRKKKLKSIPGSPPNLFELPTGCPFHPRCSRALERCRFEFPPDTVLQQHQFACWNPVRS